VGIPPAPRGVPQIEVSFDIDANGILNVSAKELGTGKEQKITITSSSGLTEDDIRTMVTDAESHSDEDRERRRKVEERNRLDQLVYTTEKTVEEHREKISADVRGEAERALEDARKALESESLTEMETASESLIKVSHKLAEAMYREAGTGEQTTATGSDDDVIDAEVVDADESTG
jgi:molecular chaperone DnaK